MNLFLIGWSSEKPIDPNRAERVFRALLRELPFFDQEALQTWRAPSGRSVAMSASHTSRQTGGVTYVHFEADRFALYSGRPYFWADEFAADGLRPLDPRFYLGPIEVWSADLDGRCVAARYDDASSALDIYTDPLGAYHVFVASEGGTKWFSNSAEVLRALLDTRIRDPLVLASLVVCGWSLGGQPLWQEVRRLPRGTLHHFAPGGERNRELLPTATIRSFFGRGLDAEGAAKTLVAGLSALADWPGRPSLVPVTGGRDSRLILAAAHRAGFEFDSGIGGDPESPDAYTARIVCERVGRSLTVLQSRTAATVGEAARILRVIAPGTDSLERAWPAFNRPVGSGLPDGPDIALALVHSGHAGEVARAHYGAGENPRPEALTRQIYRQIAHVWPRPPVGREAKHLVRLYLARWVDEQLAEGISPSDVPDLFYLLERMANWVGAANGVDEYMEDLTSPLWTPRLLPHELGPPTIDRSRELFHFKVLNELAPELAEIPFAQLNPPWPTFGQRREVRGRRMRTLGARARRELQRRYENVARRGAAQSRVTGLTEATALARERVPDRSHEIWGLLDRGRTLALLERNPTVLDVRSQRFAWRLATVFLVCVD